MKIIIDRIEGNIAVCELPDGKMINVPLCILERPSEGECYEIKKTENPYAKDINNLMNEVFK